jgi:heat shock protein HtpX
MAHMYIDNPLSAGGLSGLFSTHPPMEERIARLQAMAGNTSAPPSPPPQATSVRRGGSVPQSSRGPWGS